MRFMVYNIRYGTGTGDEFHRPIPFSGYLRKTHVNVERLIHFFKKTAPDLIGLIEVDNGSYRFARACQAERIAEELGYEHVYRSKYGDDSFAQRVPVMNRQGNAFITNQNIKAKSFHFFERGVKRLVIELECEDFVVFLVHLSLRYRMRQEQLQQLHDLFHAAHKPVLVAGDFNALWGPRELDRFLQATGLISANPEHKPTFPSGRPRFELDFILHSDDIQINHFEIPNVKLSDHMPLLVDFEPKGKKSA